MMPNRILTCWSFSLLALFVLAPAAAWAGPQVPIVVGPEAPPLERLAADDIAAMLKRLYEAEVTITEKRPAEAPATILVGSPATNPTLRSVVEDWPKLSEQGHLLRSVDTDGGPVLIVGGGSPVATFWAASELGHQFGVRSLLFGDADPATPKEFTLAGFDETWEPAVRVRAWSLLGPSPMGSAYWGLDEHRRLLRQLAKLKFNRVVLSRPPEGQQASAAEESGRKANGRAWPTSFRVDGDTAGRGAFRGTTVFENPDLAKAQGTDERSKAAVILVSGIRDAARELGLSVSMAEPPPAGGDADRLLPLGGGPLSVLPQLNSAAVARIHQTIQDGDRNGYLIPASALGELDPNAYYLSRAAFAPSLTPEQAHQDLIAGIFGEAVVGRMTEGWDHIAAATQLVQQNAPEFDHLSPDILLKHYTGGEPPPEWWNAARTHYLNAMNEMYRVNTRARQGGRQFSLYFARRMEFAFEYFNCVTALRKAAVARQQGDLETQYDELATALDSLHGALNAQAAVARTSSDRGLIAALNEYGYRPLKRELESVERRLDAE